METFAIIIFGLATVRTWTIIPTKGKKYKNDPVGFLVDLLIAITMSWCYIWFISQVSS